MKKERESIQDVERARERRRRKREELSRDLSSPTVLWWWWSWFLFLFFSRNFFLGRDEKNPTETRWSSKKGGGPRERKRVGPLNMLCLYTSPLFFSPSLSSKRVGGKLWKIRKDMITLFDLLLLYFGFFLMWLSSFLQGNSSFVY